GAAGADPPLCRARLHPPRLPRPRPRPAPLPEALCRAGAAVTAVEARVACLFSTWRLPSPPRTRGPRGGWLGRFGPRIPALAGGTENERRRRSATGTACRQADSHRALGHPIGAVGR